MANAVTQSAWSFITVTTATAIVVTDFDLGEEASYFDGYIALPKLWNRVPSPQEIADMYEEERHYFGV